MRVILIDHKITGCTRILVLGILGQWAHQSAARAMVNQRLFDDHALGNGGRFCSNLLGIAIHALGLFAVNRCTFHFRLLFKLRQFRLIRRIQHVGAHMVQALP